MPRRLHLGLVRPGIVALEAAEARHARDVLRLGAGDEVEVFDSAGNVATGTLIEWQGRLGVEVRDVAKAAGGRRVCVAAAVPKGERADWMVEKLSELGVQRLLPIITARGVVTPGEGKLDRWRRLAVQSAKQSRRQGVMRIDPPTELGVALREVAVWRAIVLSTEAADPMPLVGCKGDPIVVFVGPEGGWTAGEQAEFSSAGVEAARLTPTVLRVETAAVVAAGVLLCGGEGAADQS